MGKTATKVQKFSLKRLWPLALLAAGAGLFFALELDRYMSFEELRGHRAFLKAFVAEHAALAVLVYIAAYIALTAFSLPWASLLTLTGGFLFGPVLCTIYTVIGATIGATVVFTIAKTSIGELLRARARGAFKRMEAGFRENALSYLLILRLVPLFPFWLVNLVPAFVGVPARTFVLGTFVGIIPGTFVYALAGSGLGSILDSGEAFSIGGILTPEIIGALVGLALLALLPVVYKRIKARKG